jgi:hypothetical protein
MSSKFDVVLCIKGNPAQAGAKKISYKYPVCFLKQRNRTNSPNHKTKIELALLANLMPECKEKIKRDFY